MLSIELINDGTGDNRSANYNYRVLVNGREIAAGRVEGHDRMTRWQGLVLDLAKQAERDKWLSTIVQLAEYIESKEG